ncbi:MAG: autotransporter assembly complex protein TamA [Myxococcaceae bacterium]
MLAALSLACAHSAAEKGPIVKDLDIEGTRHVKAKDIEKKILTAKTSWIPFSRKQHFDPDIWRTDLRRIERYYREMGYYQALVLEDEVKPTDDGSVKVRVKVEEGEPTVIDSFEIKGLDELSDKERAIVTSGLELKKGDVFVESRWESLKGDIEGRLHELGYATAKATGEAEVDLVTRLAKVPVTVEVGPKYTFGDIQVKNGDNARVEEWRIREKAQGAIEPGKTYSESRKSEAQAKVFQMGVFGAAQVKNGEPDVANAKMPIVVDVREAPFHGLRFGGGAGVDQARQEVRLIGEYTNRDFLGHLRLLNVKAMAGWAFIPSAYANFSNGNGVPSMGPIARLTTELEQPRLFHPDLKLNTRVQLERQLQPAYSYYGASGRLGVVWQPTPALSIFPSYNIEAYHLTEGAVALDTAKAPQLLFGCPVNCVLSYLEQRIEYDKRDDKQEPRRGYFGAFSIQEGGGPLGGSFSYIRLQPEARAYVTPKTFDDLTFAFKVKVGTLQPASGKSSDSPIVARFYSGGGNSMRGFATQRLSPMLIVDSPTKDGKYQGQPLPIGGNSLVETSFETRYKLIGQLIVAGFLDGGLVNSSSLRPAHLADDLSAFQLAVGGGVRYLTPVGPIRLDLAYRPNIGRPLEVVQQDGQSLTYPSPTGCFGIGGKNGTRAGSPEGPCAVHISIGEAF